ncbi:MAG TPA: pyruvate:ferredoxin (flavodoxin) oxidoreductase, partial [Balneolales bacterium]|nr:pyruvate:ferredoxin (flavodoxin) oxidoreductase [Balneolales bacterium]
MKNFKTMDGNEAAAYVAHKLNEVIAIYPITPSSPMGELADQWSAQNRKNLWGTVPRIIEMQSEGGASGAVHGSLQGGSLTTTFTASQGLLLMLPNMFKIAGELTSAVFHIAARSIAAQALSIFGDHSDVMATRSAGWGMLFSGSVQEVMDMALIAQAATLRSRVPFLHIFDGFRTSHEIQKIEVLPEKVMRNLIDDDLVNAHRRRALNPDHPFVRGTAQNPDVFFQAREAVNPYYTAAPNIVAEVMAEFAKETGRNYKPFEYVGHPEAERVIILMGSGVETADETVSALSKNGEKVGAIKVRLFRPFSMKHLMDVLPSTVKAVATLDRTKEPGAPGEPLYLDVSTAIDEALSEGTAPFKTRPVVIGGRYGLSSKEFTPAMVKGLLQALESEKPRNHFTLGINDDVQHTSIDYDPGFQLAADGTTQAVFWGLGSDGTVGANKNTIKIIGEETDFYAQGYFVYDSKKAGARTISHLRFGPEPIHKPYLISEASFVGVHQFGFFERYDTLRLAKNGATLLINSPYPPSELWDKLPRPVQDQIIKKELKVYMIDAYLVAKELGLGVRINTIMQTCFFALSGVLPREEAIDKIKQAIEKTYGKRGQTIVRKNFEAVDTALSQLFELEVPSAVTSVMELPPIVAKEAPTFVQQVTAPMIAGNGDDLPVSKLPADGTYPSGTTQWEKRNIALEVPVWDPDICIQCGKCVMICPHSVIRAKVADDKELANAPDNFKTAPARWRQLKDWKYTLQVAVEDCTGCSLCVEICPVKDKRQVGRKAVNMEPQLALREQERKNWDFFLTLPEVTDKRNGSSVSGQMTFNKVKEVQLLEPLFEFSSACAGCGETPYIRLMTQLFGDHTLVANATGCSSIYGGNLPTTPWSQNKQGRGPAWSNSLFEDNAEFGLGMRLALDKQVEFARERVDAYRAVLTDTFADELLNSPQATYEEIEAQRERVAVLKEKLKDQKDASARDLLELADKLVRKTVWIVGGDGWAYDIGYGGLDHVLASGRNVNVLVLDTEVYSNTGGQASKATGLGAVAKFAAAGKRTPKKDLGLLAMGYGYVYVAQIAMGADENQTIRALQEAEAYDGPSLIIAYSHC